LRITEDIKKGLIVEYLTEETSCSTGELFEVLLRGISQRQVGETKMNTVSSRSHSVFTINIKKQITRGTSNTISSSKLNLIDLAGSENQKQAETQGERFKEAININTSLLELGQVIAQLYDKSK